MMTVSPPIAVDVAVVLTAITCPEPDAGGISASIPALPAATRKAIPWTKSAPTFARPPRDGSRSHTTTVLLATRRESREDHL